MSNDRYLRAVRALAMVGSVGAVTASCASVVVPLSDGAVVDTSTDTRADVRADTGVDTGSCLAMCPPTAPPDGTACAPMLSCSYNSDPNGVQTYCYCNANPGATCGTLRCSMAVPGPLPPPELA